MRHSSLCRPSNSPALRAMTPSFPTPQGSKERHMIDHLPGGLGTSINFFVCALIRLRGLSARRWPQAPWDWRWDHLSKDENLWEKKTFDPDRSGYRALDQHRRSDIWLLPNDDNSSGVSPFRTPLRCPSAGPHRPTNDGLLWGCQSETTERTTSSGAVANTGLRALRPTQPTAQ